MIYGENVRAHLDYRRSLSTPVPPSWAACALLDRPQGNRGGSGYRRALPATAPSSNGATVRYGDSNAGSMSSCCCSSSHVLRAGPQAR